MAKIGQKVERESNLRARIIARLDVKAPNVVKGINLEGLRVVGSPDALAQKYYSEGIDELLYIDIVASLYQRNSILDIVSRTADEVFIPITVGGGIRTLEDARRVLRAGADKVAINTAAVSNPSLISELANTFGSQCVVVNVEAKAVGAKKWEAFSDNGREHTDRDAVEWILQAQELGAGEILLTSVDHEGLGRGCDLDLIDAVAAHMKVPLIISGGVGSPEDALKAVRHGADAVAMAHILHYGHNTISQVKSYLGEMGVQCR